jgi:hypothetical protein
MSSMIDAKHVDHHVAVARDETKPISMRIRNARRAIAGGRAMGSEHSVDLQSPEILDRLLRAVAVLQS